MAKIAVTPAIVLAEFIVFRKRILFQKVTKLVYILLEDITICRAYLRLQNMLTPLVGCYIFVS